MVANPMQKKARNSFLLGVLITLIVCILIFILFYFLVIDKPADEERGEEVKAYVLSQDVDSNGVITPGMLKQITVYQSMVPSNYVDASSFSNLQSQTTDGNLVAKVAMKANTVVTSDMLTTSQSKTTNDVRYVEYNMLTLPTTLAVGDYIDIRFTLPNGQDLIVVSKKEVKSIVGDTIGLEMSEGDIVMMESAIVEAYIMTASKLYVTQYIEPGNQEAAIATYTPTDEVKALIERNSNIVDEARTILLQRFNSGIRDLTNTQRNSYSATQQENLETKLQEEIENAKAAREAYLSGLTSY